jgi:hypothetical protein
MITVVLMGGLGNQMFQYATARALAYRNNTSVRLNLRSFYDIRHWRKYELWRFAIDYPAQLSMTHVLLRQVASGLFKQKDIQDLRIFERQGLGFHPDVLGLSDGVTLRGWFQSYRYFSDCDELINREFDLDPFKDEAELETLRSEAQGCPIVAVHVRSGDYIGNSLFSLGGLDEYYSRAIELVTSCVAEPKFVLFSDDPQWCEDWNLAKRYKMLLPSTRVRRSSHFRDLACMAYCDHNIIANSTFSWWGAWLNKSPTKMVVMPARWLKPWTTNECGLDVPGWIQIDW